MYVFSEGRGLDDWSRMGVNSAPRGQLVKRIDVCGVVMAMIERRFEEVMARTGEGCEEEMARRATRGGTTTQCFVGSPSSEVSVADRRVPIITDQIHVGIFNPYWNSHSGWSARFPAKGGTTLGLSWPWAREKRSRRL